MPAEKIASWGTLARDSQLGFDAGTWPDVLRMGRFKSMPLCYIPGNPPGSGLSGSSDRSRGVQLTIDEELDLLDSSLRRLKIEYDIYFGGGSKKPPTDTIWRVTNLIKKYGDSQKLNFSQRYKLNSLTQRYAIFSDLWRQKLKIKEEGYRRPQDAVLGIAGLRTEVERAAQAALGAVPESESSKIACSDVGQEMDTVRAFYERMIAEKQKVGETAGSSFESFASFLRKKTEQIRKDFKCEAVEYSLEVQNKQVKLKAKPKTV